MIKHLEQLELINFQAHEHTILRFNKGVNVIIGSSDVGKSSIIRSIKYVKDNKPLGDSYIRHHQDSMEVHLSVTGGAKVSRKKGKENIYVVDGEILEGFGQSVPEEVSEALNLSDVNMQYQMDAPFLLSQSSGEVSRFLNKITKLDDIDTVLSNLTSMKKKSAQETVFIKKEISLLEQQLTEFPDFEEIEKEILKGELLEKEINEIETGITAIYDLILNFRTLIAETKEGLILVQSKNQVALAIDLCEEITKIDSKCDVLDVLLEDISDLNTAITAAGPVLESKDLIEQAMELSHDIDNREAEITTLDSLLREYYVISLEENSKKQVLEDIKEVYAELMPDQCPLCGK